MPRYFMRFNMADLPEGAPNTDQTFTKYLEGSNLRLEPEQSDQKTLWLKPNLHAPLGFTIFVGSALRKISVVPQQEYLQAQKGFQNKQYTCDFLPLQKGKNHIFAKYDFKITSPDTRINLRLNCPSDKYLLDYMRVKVVDKSADLHQKKSPLTLHASYVENMSLPANEAGYVFIIEGNMPYNTKEGTLEIDVNTNQEAFEFTEIVGCEPVEYSDKYTPSKYGIIFKEKVFISPSDHTSTAINIKLMKGGVDFRDAGLMKHYFFQVLDNDKIIIDKQGWNQINVSHLLFRCN